MIDIANELLSEENLKKTKDILDKCHVKANKILTILARRVCCDKIVISFDEDNDFYYVFPYCLHNTRDIFYIRQFIWACKDNTNQIFRLRIRKAKLKEKNIAKRFFIKMKKDKNLSSLFLLSMILAHQKDGYMFTVVDWPVISKIICRNDTIESILIENDLDSIAR